MKKLIGILLLMPLLAAAQAPDDDVILDRTTAAESAFYYPNLLLRYNLGDTTLTAQEYHYLYYGYALRDEYKPLAPNENFDRALLIASSLDPDKPRIEELEMLLSACMTSLEHDPFSPKLLNLMAYAYGALGDRTREAAYHDRTNKIIATIKASGDGLTEKSARHILMFDHALDVLATNDLSAGKSRVVSRTTEFIPLLSPTMVDERKVKGYFFDFSRIYRNKPEGYTYKRDRTWQFNNLKPKTYK
ncbi:MAG: DUF4919 domain-containing protein [Alistipes sp.]